PANGELNTTPDDPTRPARCPSQRTPNAGIAATPPPATARGRGWVAHPTPGTPTPARATSRAPPHRQRTARARSDPQQPQDSRPADAAPGGQHPVHEVGQVEFDRARTRAKQLDEVGGLPRRQGARCLSPNRDPRRRVAYRV